MKTIRTPLVPLLYLFFSMILALCLHAREEESIANYEGPIIGIDKVPKDISLEGKLIALVEIQTTEPPFVIHSKARLIAPEIRKIGEEDNKSKDSNEPAHRVEYGPLHFFVLEYAIDRIEVDCAAKLVAIHLRELSRKEINSKKEIPVRPNVRIRVPENYTLSYKYHLKYPRWSSADTIRYEYEQEMSGYPVDEWIEEPAPLPLDFLKLLPD